ncbi:MFS transporter [Candidatus Pelagibacter sp.]|nr:MFS transporter [Candidatus Pelagibacter sp.]
MKDIDIFFKEKPLKMICLGFSSGLPILLVFSTLSVWLIQAGINRSTVTLFSWAGFAYAFKYLWSPLVDNYNLPFLKKLGHRKSWLLTSQILIIIALVLTAFTDPQNNLFFTALFISLLAFFSATQDILVDAFRIESAPQSLQGPMSSMYIAGYRIAMLVAGAGSLWLAALFGTEIYNQEVWKKVYLAMSSFMFIGIFATISSNEPKIKRNLKTKNHLQFLFAIFFSVVGFIFLYSIIDNPFDKKDIFLTFLFSIIRLIICFIFAFLIIKFLILIKFTSEEKISKSYLGPIINFVKRYGKFAFLILLLISLYRIADVVMGVMANIFYLEKGYKISEIATFSKFFGVFATIIGGFIGGYFSFKFGTMRGLFFGALVAALSNLLFAWLAVSPISINFLVAVITADNISSGFAGAAFVIYLSGLTSIKFTATQYALFSSIMLFLPKLIAGYAGSWVDVMGYAYFFSLTALLGLPVLLLIFWIGKVAPIKN